MTGPVGFVEGLAFANSAKYKAFFEKELRESFLVSNLRWVSDKNSQLRGIDAIAVFPGGAERSLEFKMSTFRSSDPLVLLEVDHLKDSGETKDGWIEKPLHCDYLAFGFEHLKVVELLPWDLLVKAYRRQKVRWIKFCDRKKNGFKWIVSGKNDGYKTRCLGVPINTVRESIKDEISSFYSREIEIHTEASLSQAIASLRQKVRALECNLANSGKEFAELRDELYFGLKEIEAWGGQ